jgi:large subunit ribosomal protein L20
MRIKRGQTRHRRHKAVLSLAKGYRLSNSKLYKRAHEAMMHAGQYSLVHRKHRYGQFREIWIERINAALTPSGLRYSEFINALKTNKIELNRKMLAGLALNYPETFTAIVSKVK